MLPYLSVEHDHNFYGKIKKIYRQINVFTKELTKELILRKIFEHDQHNVEIIEIYSHASLAKISWKRWFDGKKFRW